MDNLFFIISKLVWGLLSPISLIIWITSLATVLLWLNKISTAKWLFLAILMINLSLLVYPVSDYLMFPLEQRFSKPEILPETIDGIIILGGGEELKLSLSWKTAELGKGGDRYIATAALAKHYPEAPVIFSGGSGLLRFQGLDKEGHIAQQLLTTIGINNSRIILESNSRNTYENFQLMKPLLPNVDGQYLLVTSAFHMPRAVGIARRENMNVIPYPVDYRSNHPAMRQWDFDLFEHLEVIEPAWREWIGLTVYYVTGKTSSWFPAPENELAF